MNIWVSGKSLIKHYCMHRKEFFHSNLTMEDIKDSDYNDAKRVYKGFKMKNLGDYHDYVKNDTLLLPDVFENFRKMCLKNYKLDQEKCLSAT